MNEASRSEFRAVILIGAMVTGYLLITKLASPTAPADAPIIYVADQQTAVTSPDAALTPADHSRVHPTKPSSTDRTATSPRSVPQKHQSAKRTRQPTAGSVVRCSPFDPNSVAKDTLIAWGIRRYVASNLDKYRQKGGHFRSPADVARIYGMDSSVLAILQGCMTFEKATSATESDIRNLCINRASSEEWRQLRGIGPVLAERIVKFRSALGGFASIDQVAETYGLPAETFESISSRLTRKVDHTRIPVNLATTEMLASHPYIDFRQARAITNYIRNHGALDSASDLQNLASLTPDAIDQVADYLDFTRVEGSITATENQR